MIRKPGLVALAVLLLVTLVVPAAALASSPPRVLSSSVEVNFPTTLSFKINAQSDADITDIRLQYQVERFGFAEVTAEGYLMFTPARTVQGSWDWDLRKSGGLPPGTVIHYWWVVTDSANNTLKTDPATFTFYDTRYKWRVLTQNKIVLHWYVGDDVFAGKLMTAAQQAMDRMTRDTGARLDQTVNLYIYGSSQDLRGSMIFPQEWTGGVAFTDFNSIAIGISTGELDWGTGAIAHELTHLLVHQMTANPYNELPTWLNEGLAMYGEGSLDSSYVTLLGSAVTKNRLISVRSLVSPFSAYGDQSALAYAESYSLISFLIAGYGQAKMFDLLSTFKQGSGYDDAFMKLYGFDMDGLNDLWRQSLTVSPAPKPTPSAKSSAATLPAETGRPGPVATAAVLVLVIVLLIGIFVMARKWVWRPPR